MVFLLSMLSSRYKNGKDWNRKTYKWKSIQNRKLRKTLNRI